VNCGTLSQQAHRESKQGRSGARVAAAIACMSLVVAGCGSTVQTRSAGTLSQTGLGGAVSTDGGLSRTQDGTAAVGSGGAGAAMPQGAGGAAQGGTTTLAGTPGQSPANPAAGSSTRGATSAKTPIKIGIITQPGLESLAKSFGLDGVTTGDTRKQAEAVIAWIRANGGLGGHPIQVYEYAVDTSETSADKMQNEACSAMAQDYKVRFVVTVLANLQVLAACLQKFGVGLLADNTNFGDKTMRQFAPALGNPSEMAPGRMMKLLVDDLYKRKWLTSTSKIGLLADDGPDGHATVDGPLTAALRSHGLKAASTVFINPKSGDGGSSQSSSAVLRFRSDGVDKVIPVMYSPVYFMIAAENQGYRPAYAMVSAQGPGALIEGLAPQNQLKNAAGIGWAPYLDIGKGKKPPAVSARATLCFELMKKAGQAATSALVKGFQAQVCDILFYLKALADLKPGIPADILTSGRIALGKSYVSPATYRVDVTNRTDGVAGYRPLAYLDDCECFQYVGPVQSAP
jgi:hypothetical protein